MGIRLFVTVGTDHHPFDRLISWTEEFLESYEPFVDKCWVQFGSSRQPRWGESADFLKADEMKRYVEEADVVVCHGGPATIGLVWQAGLRPLVVPREPEFGEHVDGHQGRYVEWLMAWDLAYVARSSGEFEGSLRLGGPGCLDRDDEVVKSLVRGKGVKRAATLLDDAMSAEDGNWPGRGPRYGSGAV